MRQGVLVRAARHCYEGGALRAGWATPSVVRGRRLLVQQAQRARPDCATCDCPRRHLHQLRRGLSVTAPPPLRWPCVAELPEELRRPMPSGVCATPCHLRRVWRLHGPGRDQCPLRLGRRERRTSRVAERCVLACGDGYYARRGGASATRATRRAADVRGPRARSAGPRVFNACIRSQVPSDGLPDPRRHLRSSPRRDGQYADARWQADNSCCGDAGAWTLRRALRRQCVDPTPNTAFADERLHARRQARGHGAAAVLPGARKRRAGRRPLRTTARADGRLANQPWSEERHCRRPPPSVDLLQSPHRRPLLAGAPPAVRRLRRAPCASGAPAAGAGRRVPLPRVPPSAATALRGGACLRRRARPAARALTCGAARGVTLWHRAECDARANARRGFACDGRGRAPCAPWAANCVAACPERMAPDVAAACARACRCGCSTCTSPANCVELCGPAGRRRRSARAQRATSAVHSVLVERRARLHAVRRPAKLRAARAAACTTRRPQEALGSR